MANYNDYLGKAKLPSGYPVFWTGLSGSKGDTVVGTGANEIFYDNGSNKFIGNGGDDLYQMVYSDTVIVEQVNGGNDTIRAFGTHRAPPNVETIHLFNKETSAIANDEGMLLIALGEHQRLVGGHGNDVMADESTDSPTTFVINSQGGKDVIYGFSANGEKHDAIQLSNLGITSYDRLSKVMTQVGSDVNIQIDTNNAILIKNISLSSLSAKNFLLSFDPSNLKLTFNDEFNSLSLYDAQSNTGKWKTVYDWGPLNGPQSEHARSLLFWKEEQLFVDTNYTGMTSTNTVPLGLNPFSVKDGLLTITATKVTDPAIKANLGTYNYTSGMLSSSGTFAQTYGYFEARMKLTDDQGLHPAFWMFKQASDGVHAEIDVMENVSTNYYSMGTLTDVGNRGVVTDDTFADGFHKYAVLWTAERITWYIDDQAVYSIPTPAHLHQPMYLHVTLAVGDSWAGDTASDFTSGNIQVDYVRAYQIEKTATVTPGPDSSASDNTYIVADTGKVIVEGLGQGYDTVKASISYTLPDNVEALVLTGNAAINGKGNALNNALYGNDGNNILNGAAGADTMAGGKGDDIYIVDKIKDIVTEKTGEGWDAINSTISYTLPDNVEALRLLGKANINGKGNGLANQLMGSEGRNYLSGGAGKDYLDGLYGNDVLTGGTGADTFNFNRWQGNDVITDFGFNGEPDLIDIRQFLQAGIKPVLTMAGSDTLISFSTGDSIQLLGVSMDHLKMTSTGFVYNSASAP